MVLAERLRRIVAGNSESYAAIQMADMVAGAVHAVVRKQDKEDNYLHAAHGDVMVLRITPDMEKPTK